GHECRGDRGHGALHPLRRTSQAPDRGDDRARHGRGHGHLESRRRAGLRQEDRRGPSGARAAGCERHQGLPRRGRRGGMTLPQMLAAHARRYGRGKVALREKRYGIWQEATWEDYAAHVRAVGLGLEALGLRRGGTIAIVCGNRPAWLYTQLGAQALGAIPVGVYVDSPPHPVRYAVAHTEARLVVVGDQEQADKVLGVRAHLPRLERIVVDDTRGLEDYHEPLLISLDEVERLGREADARDRGRWDALLASGKPDDIALLAYTSGTTAAPKAAMISHRNLLAMAAGMTQVDRVLDTDDIVSFLPFSC